MARRFTVSQAWALAVAGLLVACGASSAPRGPDGSSGTGGAGGVSDGGAGPAAGGDTGGSGAGGPVASGSAGGATSGDAGASGGGAGGAPGAGTGGGPTARIEVVSDTGDCAAVLPTELPAPRVAALEMPDARLCAGATSDGDGRVALESVEPSTGVHFYQAREPDGSTAPGEVEFWAVNFTPLAPQPHGYHGVEVPLGSFGGPRADHKVVDGKGVTQRSTRVGTDQQTDFLATIAPVPGGGSVAFYDAVSILGNHGSSHAVVRFAADGTPGTPVGVGGGGASDLAHELAAAVSTAGSAFALRDGQGGFLVASWVHPDGSSQPVDLGERRGGDFLLLPLVDGGIAIRVSGAWIGQVRAHSGVLDLPPTWGFDAGPGRRVALLPRARGYVTLPTGGATASPCEQTLEIVAPSGAYCGRVLLRFSDGACTTKRVDMGLDGTLLQQSPTDGCSGGRCTCTHAWWSGALR
jgi:hypothetical protein